MFDAFELGADFEARRRMGAALMAAATTLGALTVGVVLVATRPVVEAESRKKVDVSFRPPPPPPPEPVRVEPPPKPKPPPPKPVAEVAPPAAPAPAPMVAPKEVPKAPNVESDVAVAAREVAVGGTGSGLPAAAPPDEDESPAPVVAVVGSAGPVNLPEEADPPEPDEGNPQPEYPEAMRTTGQESKVVLKIVVEADGSVGRVQVLKGDEPFVSAALQAVRSWRYQPARLEGQPISVFKIVNLTFQLRE